MDTKEGRVVLQPCPERALMKELGDGRDRDQRGDTEREGGS